MPEEEPKLTSKGLPVVGEDLIDLMADLSETTPQVLQEQFREIRLRIEEENPSLFNFIDRNLGVCFPEGTPDLVSALITGIYGLLELQAEINKFNTDLSKGAEILFPHEK